MKKNNELMASQQVLSMLERACEYSEQILDNIPSVFVVLNRDNRIIRANVAFCELLGCTMEAALHLDFTAFFTSENRGILLHHMARLRGDLHADGENHVRVKLEFAGTAAHQPAKPFYWRIFPLEHVSEAEGRVISVVGDDLSVLYQSELKLMSIFSSIPLGLMVVDCRGVITEVLSEYCHVLLNNRQLVGASLQTLLVRHNPDLHDELAQAFEVLAACADAPMSRFAEQEGLLSGVEQLRASSDGEADKWIKPRVQPIAKNNRIDRYMVTLEDITASHLAQKRIERADMLGKQAQALYKCAIRDPLSGLYSRLFMNDSVSRLVSSAKRGSLLELSIVMFDLDNFKSINDTYGHDAGDRVIKEFGRVIKSCTRDADIAVRYGGEEFIVAVPSNDSSEQGGGIVAERIRAFMAGNPIDIGDGRTLNVTTSCGVAFCRRDDTMESLMQRADKHLYLAKQGGKNRVCVEPTKGP